MVRTAPVDGEPTAAPASTNGVAFLTRDAILSIADIKTEVVDVPEWGGSLRVRGLSGAQRDDFEEAMIARRGRNTDVNLRNFRARLVQRSVIDESGALLFTDGDVATLGSKSAIALQRVYRVAERLSGIATEEVDELTKGFSEDQNDDSGSA